MLYVGQGQDQVMEYSGNFFISDYIQQRIALTNYTINDAGDGYNLTLSYATYWVQNFMAVCVWLF